MVGQLRSIDEALLVVVAAIQFSCLILNAEDGWVGSLALVALQGHLLHFRQHLLPPGHVQNEVARRC